ncbi:hypothetical protein BBOV_III006470 [Babesia bovis T2Bo]|uniref:Uncharacterized protein n=1 Tax=Babesia bovis TaxID=5865 RepID=A7ANS4_BABBO|nr:hypothetical protein BBOV_III006470 [Babesia bovis T2Bo]EDO08208.1 hypothetical protein BBOV_III006470 [Babesia bovis T2Bo]|eukprot:XP_001611776.1 hypothetical protein [Babesia bovis T2Bo]
MAVRSIVNMGPIWTCLLLICPRLSYALEVDLMQPTIPYPVESFEGSFYGGGRFRLIHSSTPSITLVKYGNLTIFNNMSGMNNSLDVYVQEYRRGIGLIVSIIDVDRTTNESRHIRHFEIVEDQLTLINRMRKLDFVNGPISLMIDLWSIKLNPLVIKTTKGTNIRYRLARHYNAKFRDSISRIRGSYDVFLISPIMNIDWLYQTPGSSQSLISSHSIRVHVDVVLQQFTLWIKHKGYVGNYTLSLPLVVNGMFKAQHILDPSYRNVRPIPTGGASSTGQLEIDVSRFENSSPEVIVVANLRRGCWLYRQYCIVPFPYPEQVVRVINSQVQTVIYESSGVLVTHVEVFDHVVHGWEYVVVNTMKVYDTDINDEFHTETVREVFKRMSSQGPNAYFDLSMICRCPYVKMLYSISIWEQSCVNVDVHDLVESDCKAVECS